MFGLFGGGTKSMSMREARAEMEKDPGVFLLDVRTPEEYRGGHIRGSVNIPLERLPAQLAITVPDKGKRIFVYCLSGSRSAQAVGWMTRNGYTDVTNIGGIMSWTGEVAGG